MVLAKSTELATFLGIGFDVWCDAMDAFSFGLAINWAPSIHPRMFWRGNHQLHSVISSAIHQPVEVFNGSIGDLISGAAQSHLRQITLLWVAECKHPQIQESSWIRCSRGMLPRSTLLQPYDLCFCFCDSRSHPTHQRETRSWRWTPKRPLPWLSLPL